MLAKGPHVFGRQIINPLAQINHLPLCFGQAQQCQSEGRFTGTGFTHKPDGFPRAHRQRHTIDGFDMAGNASEKTLSDGEPDADVFGFDDNGCIGGRDQRHAAGLCRQQALGIGMLRLLEHIGHQTGFNNMALLHDRDMIGQFAHNAEIMRDKQHRHATPFLDALQQCQNLRLHSHIQRCGRFIGNQQIWLIGQSHCNHHALPLAAG